MTSSSRTSANPTVYKYFDLITTGVGRLQRVRPVHVPRKDPLLACGIKAFHGRRGSAATTAYDLIVVGHDAKDYVIANAALANDVRKDVLVKFSIGDSRVHTFPVPDGLGATLKGRLLGCESFHPSAAVSEYELTTRGIGYLNFVREVRTESQWILTCNINALSGREDEISHVPFDVTVIDETAAELVRQYAAVVNDGQKVLVGFALSGARIHSFDYTGVRQGEIGHAVEAGLSSLSFVTVNGERTYDAPRTSDESSDADVEDSNASSEDSRAA